MNHANIKADLRLVAQAIADVRLRAAVRGEYPYEAGDVKAAAAVLAALSRAGRLKTD
jgi:cytochrome c556